MYQVCKHTICEWPHGLVHCQAISNQDPLVQKLIDLRKENLPVIEVDDMPDSY